MADVDYEAVLEEEGLAPVRDGVADRTTNLGHRLRNTRATTVEALPDTLKAHEAWSTWATGILGTYTFGSERSKRIWAMYAEGRKFSEIATAEGISRGEVYQYTDRVKRRCPPPPTRHPHRKSGGDARIEDFERLRKTVVANPELLQLQGENMAQRKVMYSKIQFMQGRHLNIPGNSVSKEFLFNVEGTPHAGGIDLEVDARDKEYKPVAMVITAPWHSIRQADRAAVDG